MAFAKSASNLSNTGSPSPAGQPLTTICNFAPTESPSFISSSNKASNSLTFEGSAKLNLFFVSQSIVSAAIGPI